MKITVEEQVVSDFQEYIKLTNDVMAKINEEKPMLFTVSDYLLLMELVMDHIHWVIEFYPVASEQGAAHVETKAI